MLLYKIDLDTPVHFVAKELVLFQLHKVNFPIIICTAYIFNFKEKRFVQNNNFKGFYVNFGQLKGLVKFV